MSLSSRVLTVDTFDDGTCRGQQGKKGQRQAAAVDDKYCEDEMPRGPYECKLCKVPLAGHACPFKVKRFYLKKRKRIVKCTRGTQSKGE